MKREKGRRGKKEKREMEVGEISPLIYRESCGYLKGKEPARSATPKTSKGSEDLGSGTWDLGDLDLMI